MSFFSDEECSCAGQGICAQCLKTSMAGDDGPALSPDTATWFGQVLQFFKSAHGPGDIPESPKLQTPAVELYWKLVEEELTETCLACKAGNILDVADGIADTIWVLMGLAIASGIDLRPVWEEVRRSNMEKLGAPKREDGKLTKPLDWRPPDIAGALAKGRLL